MLEKFFTQPKTLSRLQSGLFGSHLSAPTLLPSRQFHSALGVPVSKMNMPGVTVE